MAISFRHAFTSGKVDGTDSTLIQPSNWNAEHTLTLGAGKVLGRDSSAGGAAQELAISVDPTQQSMIPPSGGTGARPATAIAGMLRYNTSLSAFEGFMGSVWSSFASLASANTFTEEQSVSLSSGSNRFSISASSGSSKFVRFQTAGSSRWELGSNNAPETGANNGSDFIISRYDDTGAYIDSPFSIERDTGVAKLASLDIGNTDTTITRSSGGVIAVEGGVIPKENRANTFTAAQSINGANLLLNSNSDYEPQTQLTHAGATAGSGAYSILKRARGAYGSPTVVSSGDQVGTILFQAHDGTVFQSAASIESQVDGTPGAGDMPGRLAFKTSADGSASPTERMRVDSSGRILINDSGVARSNFLNASLASAGLQVEGTGATASAVSVVRDSANANGPRFLFGKSRGATVGSNALVSSGDSMGSVTFQGNDGSEFVEGAVISSAVDGTAAADTMPGRLEFLTAGASGGPVERMRIDSSGNALIGYTTSNGPLYKLQVNSQIFATSATIATSDGNYKEDITPLNGALELVSALNPVQFSWKEHPVHNFDRAQPTVGFIAQEVQQALADTPYLNSIVKANTCTIEREEVDSEGNVTKPAVTEEFLGIAEGNMIALLTKAIQELKAEFDAYKASHP